MKQYTLYLGLVTRDLATVKPNMRQSILDDAAKTFGGYTAVSAIGGWVDKSFTVQEPSLRIEVITDAPYQTVKDWAERARLLANQKEVILTVSTLEVQTIGESNNDVFDPVSSGQIGRRYDESLRN